MQQKQSEGSKEQDDKVKKLKKRNTELAGIARKLEEKAKGLQAQMKSQVWS